MKSRRAILTAPHAVEIQEFDIEPNDDQVLLKTKVCGMCNWELNHWGGTYGTYPQPAGHEWGGTIVKVGKNVTKYKVGDRVTALPMPHCTPGFADYIVADECDLFKVNNDVDLVGAMLEPLKCIITVVKSTECKAGDWGVVVGTGPMGLWCIQALRGHLLAGIIAVDIDDEKLARAKKYGATHVVNSKTQDAEKVISEITSGHMGDFVIEGTGVPEVMNQAVTYVAIKGRVCMMSSASRPAREIDFRPCIYRGATIAFPHPCYSRDERDDARRAAEYINNGTFEVAPLVNYRFTLDEIGKAFETLEHKPKDYIKGAIVFPD